MARRRITPNRTADTAVFFVAYLAFSRWAETSSDPAVQKHLKIAEQLIKRFGPPMTEAIEGYSEVIRKKFSMLKADYARAVRSGSPLLVATRQAQFLVTFISRLSSRAAIRRELFDGRSLRSIMALSAASEADSDLETLQKCAAIAPVSGVQLLRKWMEKAASLAGVPVSDFDSLTNDVGAAVELGTKLGAVRNTLDNTDPVSPKAASLQGEKIGLEGQIRTMAEVSADPNSVVAAAATATSNSYQHSTAIGKKLGHTPDQEQAMVAQGRTLIAAGAGSGKTRVLASKVAWHMENGTPASAILATSFTRKSSAELVRRVGEYGGVINQDAADGFGTTHSIAGQMLNKHARQFRRPNGYFGKAQKWKQVTVLRLAVEQVKMPGGGQAPPPLGIWEGDFVPAGGNPTGAGGAPQVDNDFIDSVDGAISYWQWVLRQPWARYKRWTRPGSGYIDFLKDVRGKHPSELAAQEKALVNKIFTKAQVYGKPITYRVANTTSKQAVPNLGQTDDLDGELVHEEKKRSSKLSEYEYYKRPAGQWFNLGQELSREDRQGKKKDIPLGNFARYISVVKGKGISPTQAWHNGVEGQSYPKSDEAAVYAAYEWMKGSKGEPSFQGAGDMDDILIDTVRALVASPALRSKVQSRYKVLLVDEAQDLNQVQHLMFGLMAGYYDPETLEPNADKSMTAETFALIGDDKQCVGIDTPISLPDGRTKKAGDLQPGDKVLSYRNGEICPQTVRHVVPSSWTWGYKVTTESGNVLEMSPNHKLWATEPQTEEDENIVYLMHRRDLGFRVGVTGMGRDDEHMYLFGQRPVSEKAEKFWVLDICKDRGEALTLESTYSLQYGIPTLVYHTEGRRMNASLDGCIQKIFGQFGQNGARLLKERDLSFDLPHWVARTFTKEGRYTIQIVAHGPKGTQVNLEVRPEVDLGGIHHKETRKGTRVVRKFFHNYREGLAFAEALQRQTGVLLARHISSPVGYLREITASGLFVGMELMCHSENDSVDMDRIVAIQKINGEFVDLDVDDASNFVASALIVSNSIYEFRGADPDEFINKSDLKPGGDNFSTNVLQMNFRSGEAIVNAANKLIEHNTRQGKQIPMVCTANVAVKGQGTMVRRSVPDTEAAALAVADEIEALVNEGQTPPHNKKTGAGGYADFGVALRSNAEAYAYGLELLKKGIPFKSNARFFNDRNSKALIGWLTLAEGGPPAITNRALLDALAAPTSKVSPNRLSEKLGSYKGSWADYIQTPAGVRAVYGRYKRMTDRLEHFASNVGKAQHFTGSPQEVLQQILQLVGVYGASFSESLVDSVKDNSDVMAELEASAEGGIVREDDIVEMAMAPIKPLIALMGQKEDLGGAMDFVRKLQKVNAKISSKDDVDEIDRDAVTIGTMHSWKGLESPNMFIPMVGGRFPRTPMQKDSEGQLVSGDAPEGPALWAERRLAYVAITRAEDRCVILDIPNPKTGATSQFLTEACVPYEGTPPEDDPSLVKMGATGVVWDAAAINNLLKSLDEVPSEIPETPDTEAPGLEQMWGEVI